MFEKQSTRLSLLITAYRNSELVGKCLDSIVGTFKGAPPEIVVVDDTPGDPAIRAVVERYSHLGVKFAVMPQNGGFAGANNFGYGLCTREFVVLVNTDIVFYENPFPAMLDFMDSHPKAGIIQGTILIKNGEPGIDGCLNGCGAYMTQFGSSNTIGWLKPASDPVASAPRRCLAAYGAMFMIRRDVIASTNGRLFYDFFHTYYEEVDFCHRANLAGWEVWYVPTPIIDHAHGATMSKFYPREDVMRKFYRNQRFSFWTCFGLRGLLTVYPVYELCCVGQSLAQLLLRFRASTLRAHLWALRYLWRHRHDIRAHRREIQGYRVLDDRSVFRFIRKNFTMREFFELIRKSV